MSTRRTRIWIFLSSLVVLFVFTGVALRFAAQDGRPFGPPGFGPPGFGPPAGPVVAMLRMDKVREELALDDREIRGVDDWIEETSRMAMDEGRKMFEFMGPPGESDEEMDDAQAEEEAARREKSMVEIREKLNDIIAHQEHILKDRISEPSYKRLQELKVQREGVRSLLDREVAKRLELSEAQRESLKDILQSQNGPPVGGPGGFPFGPGGGGPFGPGGGGPFGPGGGGPGGGGPGGGMNRQVPDEVREKALAILDDKQKTNYESLKGKAFEFPQQMGFPGPNREKLAIKTRFDKDNDKWLNAAERREARAFAKSQSRRGPGGPRGNGPNRGPGFGGPGGGGGGPGGGFGFGPPGGGPGGGREQEPVSPGPKISKESVTTYADKSLYADDAIRTIFFQFDNDDWESEMEDFHQSDVDVPATMQVDGEVFKDVGVRFRGLSSYSTVQAGHKRSFNVSLDDHNSDQRWKGRKTLNLLNAHEDPSFLHTVLYLEAANKYIPAPKANFVQVVVNGESWGLYVSAEQFDKEFVKEHFEDSTGTRWKVPGSPGGGGGLQYVGDKVDDYKRTFDIKTRDNDDSWQALINLCRILNETPTEELESKIEPILDVEGALRFLAIDNTLVNSDGYWIRASDYAIYMDGKGVFHLIPHDANETLRPPMGPGMGPPGMGPPGMGPPGMGGMGPRGGGRGMAKGDAGKSRRDDADRKDRDTKRGDRAADSQSEKTDRPRDRNSNGERNSNQPRNAGGDVGSTPSPLVAIDDPTKPLYSKLLKVEKYRKRYLELVAKVNDEILTEKYLSDRISHYTEQIDEYVRNDTRKLESYESFQRAVSLNADSINRHEGKSDSEDRAPRPRAGRAGPRGRNQPSLIEFANARHAAIEEFLAKESK